MSFQVIPKHKIDEWYESDIAYLNNITDTFLSTKEKIPIIEFVENNRFLPAGLSPQPGFYQFSKTPYLKEIIECLDYKSPIQQIDVKKGAQLGFTVGLSENWMLYIISQNPTAVMFVAQTQTVAEDIFQKRIEPAIDHAGVRHLIKSQKQQKNNRRTGDTSSSKEFVGGYINIVGLRSVSRLKSFSIQYIAITEADEAPASIGGQGDPISILERRQDSFSATKKILCESTPALEKNSNIEPRFKGGDQRYYNVPCKHCGELQVLDFANMLWELDESGILIEDSVYYECKFCKGRLKNSDKDYFLLDHTSGGKARWIPTSKAHNPRRRSYQMSSLYSPVGLRGWDEIVRQFLIARENESYGDNRDMILFTNQVLGDIYKEKDESPPYDIIKANNTAPFLKEYLNYGDELVPCNMLVSDIIYKPMFCTIAVDIQKNYIEAGVMLWAQGMRSYTIGYHRLAGNTSDINDKSWQLLEKIIKSKHVNMYASVVFIDYGYNAGIVSTFCEKLSTQTESGAIVFPVKGMASGKLYNVSQETQKNPPLININVNHSKSYVYTRLSTQKINDASPNEYCFFATDLDIDFFKMLTSEERRRKTLSTGREVYEWVLKRGQKRNEALDITGYNIVAAFYFCDSMNFRHEDGTPNWKGLWEVFESSEWQELRETYPYKTKCTRCNGTLNYYNEYNNLEVCDMCEDGYIYY